MKAVKYGMERCDVWDEDYYGPGEASYVSYIAPDYDPYESGMKELLYGMEHGYHIHVVFHWPDTDMAFALDSNDPRFKPYSVNRFRRLINRHHAYHHYGKPWHTWRH